MPRRPPPPSLNLLTSRMGSLGQTRFGVIAPGMVAGALILWLSASFWFDAWLQRQDAIVLQRVVAIDTDFVAVTDELLEERRVTLTVLAQARPPGRLVRAGLESVQRRAAGNLDALLDLVATAHDDPVLSPRLWHSPEALAASAAALDGTRRALDGQRSSNRRLFEPHEGGASWASRSSAREQAMRRTLVHGDRLIRKLHTLRQGLHVEPRTLLRSIQGLRRLSDDLRDFVVGTAHAADLVLAVSLSPIEGARRGSELVELGAPSSGGQVRRDVERLQLHMGGSNLTPAVRDQLGVLLDRAATGDSSAHDTVRISTGLHVRISDLMAHEIDAVAAHAYRRLVIDTLLIAVGLWISLACLTLLRSIPRHAWHDRLTGLVNRTRLENLLDDELSGSRSRAEPLAVLVLGIDHFAGVNSRVGHDIGDTLLRLLTARVGESLSRACTLGALGGDHFAVIVPRVAGAVAAVAIADDLRARCTEPFVIEGASLLVTLSVGVAVRDADTVVSGSTRPALELLQQAEVAMRQAKDDGRNRVHRFDLDLAARHRESIQLENDLRETVHGRQLELHYQPKVCSRSGRVNGIEALVRWHHPERGMISPGVFVPIAEQCGLITSIGAWVYNEAIRQTADWNRRRAHPLQVAVNVAARQFGEPDFVDGILCALRTHGLDARHLELEVTESVGMLDMHRVVEQLEQLRAAGVSIAIDDFGTDYSSLQYLEAMPLDTLKIDRAFILKLGLDKGRSLVGAIVGMAGSLGLGTVAEGVETAEQLARVKVLGCDHVQGYYYSAPAPAGELEAIITRIEASAEPAVQRAA